MAESRTERKVTVILATDVVGYSVMMEENEEQTLKNLKVCREIVERLIKDHHGRIFNTAGDSVLAEFQSAVEAVICATEFQNTIKERNNSVGEEEQMEFRVGVNMGDVVIEGDNLYGDGVNVAARLEALAQPGGICLSKNVHEMVNKKTDFHFNDLGEQKVKDTLLHAVDVVIDETHKRTVKTQRKSKTPLFATIAVFLILVAGGFAYYQHSMVNRTKESVEISDKPTVLIMPFANQSGNSEQDYIGLGMSTHLITMLSQFDQLLVLAKNTGEHIQKNKIPNEEIVKQYGVKYVLNGTTQAAGDRVRVNVELADLNRNSVVWSEVYDFKEEDIFEIQDNVGNSVLGHLGQEVITGSTTARQSVKGFTNPEMLKNSVLAMAAYQSWTVEGIQKAEKLQEENYKMDPDHPMTIISIGWLLQAKVLMGISKNSQQDLEEALKMALVVIEKYPDYVMAMQLAATIEAMMGKFDASCGRINKMTKSARGISEIVMTAETQRQCGDYAASIKNWEKAFKISPHYSSWIKMYYVYTLLQNGNLQAAKKFSLEQIAKDHLYYGANEAFLAMLAYIAYKEGDEQQAKEFFEKQQNMKNSMTKSYILNYDFSSVRARDFVNDYVKVLQSLGMPDQ